ncbi:MAG: hypothetical protein EB119_07565, partial [Synechococcaceae bacterium WBB_34_004]|nr:hypothetical protein [Synechococcaceae bacterium WBB_34_004]
MRACTAKDQEQEIVTPIIFNERAQIAFFDDYFQDSGVEYANSKITQHSPRAPTRGLQMVPVEG